MAITAHDPARLRFWVLIGLLAVTGVTMAFIAAFGLNDSTAFEIVWRVFVALLYLVVSFVATHTWLRLTIWASICVTFLLGLLSAFWRYTPFYVSYSSTSGYRYGDPASGWSPWMNLHYDVEAAAHGITLGLLGLGLLSLAHRWIREQPVIRGVYYFTFGVSIIALVLGAGMMVDTRDRWDVFTGWDRIEAGLIILALTAAVIVVISAFVQWRGERRNAVSAPAAQRTDLSGLTEDELRQLVHRLVDERLEQRGD